MPPAEVRTAFLLWLVDLALGVVGAVITFLSIDALITAGVEAAGLGTGDLPAGVLEGARAGAIGGVVVGLVLLALVAAAVFAMRNGRNWARILLTVLGVLSLLSGVYSLVSAGQMLSLGVLGIVSVVLTAIQVVLIAAAIWFMFRPAAAAYFARSADRR